MKEIQELHRAYCKATGFDLRLNPVYERQWWDAWKWGIKPDDVRLVVKARIKRNLTLTHKINLKISALVGDEDALANFDNEAAEIRARMRKPVYVPDKAAVLRATGRPGEPEPPATRHISELLKVKPE